MCLFNRFNMKHYPNKRTRLRRYVPLVKTAENVSSHLYRGAPNVSLPRAERQRGRQSRPEKKNKSSMLKTNTQQSSGGEHRVYMHNKVAQIFDRTNVVHRRRRPTAQPSPRSSHVRRMRKGRRPTSSRRWVSTLLSPL